MFNSFIVELVIGCAYILALLGVMVTAITEVIMACTSVRSKCLNAWLEKFVVDMKTGEIDSKLDYDKLLKSPWLAPLRGVKERMPSYIPADRLAAALLELVARPAGESLIGQDLKAFESGLRVRIGELKAPGLAAALSSLLDAAAFKATSSAELLEGLKLHCATWIDQSMNRIEGWVKRRAQVISLSIAFLLCVGLNANIVTIVNTLAKDPQTRSELAVSA